MARRARWLTLLLLMGCNVAEETVTELADLCLGPADEGGVSVSASFVTCLSSSCDTVKELRCTVERRGDIWVADVAAVIETRGVTCTDECDGLSTDCSFDPPEGTLLVTANGLEVTYEHPSSEVVCAER